MAGVPGLTETKTAVVVGSAGQDGYYLTRLLSGKGYDIIGLSRSGLSNSRGRRERPVDIEDGQAVAALIRDVRPAEVYYLAAHHRSSEDDVEDIYGCFLRSLAVHVCGLLNFLGAIDRDSHQTRLFYAASSHIFGDPQTVPQTEMTPLAPTDPYGITKACGLQMCRAYRRDRGLFSSVGIMYNHESPRRSPAFVTRKIVQAVVAIKRGERDRLVLGDLGAAIDWGVAADYVEAMHRILSLDEADDFVVASGETHTVGEFAETAFRALGLDSGRYLIEDSSLISKAARRRPLVGDASKLRRRTGWTPSQSFEDMVRDMVTVELAADPT